MEFYKIGDYYINPNQIKYIVASGENYKIVMDNYTSINISASAAKKLGVPVKGGKNEKVQHTVQAGRVVGKGA